MIDAPRDASAVTTMDMSDLGLSTATVAHNPEILFTAVGDETVLMSTDSGKYYGLDDIGADIWNRLQTPVAVADLCAAMAADYDGAADEIARDIIALLGRLAEDGLIEVRT